MAYCFHYLKFTHIVSYYVYNSENLNKCHVFEIYPRWYRDVIHSFELLHWTSATCWAFLIHFLRSLVVSRVSLYKECYSASLFIDPCTFLFVSPPRWRSKMRIGKRYGVSIFTRSCQFFSTMVVSVYISTKSLSEFPIPHILTAIHKQIKYEDWEIVHHCFVFPSLLLILKIFTYLSLVFSVNCSYLLHIFILFVF